MPRFLAMRVPQPRLVALAASLGMAALAAACYVGGAGGVAAQQGAARGAVVYQNNCQVCHGVNAQGRIGPPLNEIPPEVRQLPRPGVVQELTGLVRNGIPGAMPRFVPEQLSDADIAALTDYLLDTVPTTKPAGPGYYEALQPVSPMASTADRTYFPQTQHSVAGAFKRFHEANGGVRIFGYPITEEYMMTTDTGEVIMAQDFERARFESRPGKEATGVELGLIGAEWRSLRTHFLEGGEDEEPPASDPERPGGPPGPATP